MTLVDIAKCVNVFSLIIIFIHTCSFKDKRDINLNGTKYANDFTCSHSQQYRWTGFKIGPNRDNFRRLQGSMHDMPTCYICDDIFGFWGQERKSTGNLK